MAMLNNQMVNPTILHYFRPSQLVEETFLERLF
jgi:hypothetical protein